MSAIPVNRMRDQLKRWVPWWLSDRFYSSGKTVGFRFLWAMIAMLDYFAQWILEGLIAPWPGAGTLTALSLIGRSRGILRGQADTDATYALRLVGWLDRWRIAGSAEAIGRSIQEFLANKPMVRVITRAGQWVTINADGSLTRANATWNWDGVSNPERAGFWSDIWIVVYPAQWSTAQAWGDGRVWGGRNSGLGHLVTRQEVDAIKGQIAQWKSAHTNVRCVIWSTNAALFDPAVPASCPNGTWGEYGTTGAGSRVAARDTTCRYWEP